MRPRPAYDDETGFVVRHIKPLPDGGIRLCCANDLFRLLQWRYRSQVGTRRHLRKVLLEAVRRKVGNDMAVFDLDRRAVFPVYEQQVKDVGALLNVQRSRDLAARVAR